MGYVILKYDLCVILRKIELTIIDSVSFEMKPCVGFWLRRKNSLSLFIRRRLYKLPQCFFYKFRLIWYFVNDIKGGGGRKMSALVNESYEGELWVPFHLIYLRSFKESTNPEGRAHSCEQPASSWRIFHVNLGLWISNISIDNKLIDLLYIVTTLNHSLNFSSNHLRTLNVRITLSLFWLLARSSVKNGSASPVHLCHVQLGLFLWATKTRYQTIYFECPLLIVQFWDGVNKNRKGGMRIENEVFHTGSTCSGDIQRRHLKTIWKDLSIQV